MSPPAKDDRLAAALWEHVIAEVDANPTAHAGNPRLDLRYRVGIQGGASTTGAFDADQARLARSALL